MTTSTARPGVISWALGIRTTMVNDPGRQYLEDQIQSNGFFFLDDYLDNILSGPRHDPIIELVKTPGRKRDVPKKTRAAVAAAAKVKSVISLSLESDVEKRPNIDSHHEVPINKFHEALLTAKESPHRGQHLSLPKSPDWQMNDKGISTPKKVANKKAVVIMDAEDEAIDISRMDDEDEEQFVEQLVTPPHAKLAIRENHSVDPLPPVLFSQERKSLAPLRETGPKDLSVIAEGDESIEPNIVTFVADGADTAAHELVAEPLHDPPIEAVDDLMHLSNLTNSTSGDTFHSIPLDSPQHVIDDVEFSTATLLRMAPLADFSNQEVPLSVVPSVTQVHAGPSNGLTRKLSIPYFPTIGAPSPLRKSVRIPREHSLAIAPVVPAPAPAAKRSSWLIKAREAKAIEDNAKKISILNIAPATVSNAGTKRKSGEMSAFLESENALERNVRAKVENISEETEDAPPTKAMSARVALPLVHEDIATATSTQPIENTTPLADCASEGMMDRLKKTVEGFSARAGKSMGKSLGGAAATALAEARAAAEARVAERHAAEGRTVNSTVTPQEVHAQIAQAAETLPSRLAVGRVSEDAHRRFSVSDLVTAFEHKGPSKGKEIERVFQAPSPSQLAPTVAKNNDLLANMSTSTTPPNSPPPVRPPIFTAPKLSKPLPSPTFFLPPSQPLPTNDFLFTAPIAGPSLAPLSAQSTLISTQSSAFSDVVFDHHVPAWLPSTQDTVYSENSQQKYKQQDGPEADESWHMDDNFIAVTRQWTPSIGSPGRDESMTWSTVPTQSQRGDTGSLQASKDQVAGSKDMRTQDTVPGGFGGFENDAEADMELDEDVEEEIPDSQAKFASQPNFAEGTHNRSNSQTAIATSQLGFLGAASKLVSSVLGGSKKGKTEPVKSLQLAAVVAKKQQEEKDKKAVRLKEMEARRQQVLQKKADEEKAREEKQAQEESNRRKRDKDEPTEKRVLRAPAKATPSDDESNRKRNATVDVDKKPDARKPPSKEKKDIGTSRIGKPGLNVSQATAGPSTLGKSLKQPSAATLMTSTAVKSVAVAVVESRPPVVAAPSAKKGKAKDDSLSGKQPSQLVNAQMQARVEAQLEEIRKAEQSAIPSESIELPDINSEYSDSEDEDRVRTFDPPDWAQSPELREALQTQSSVNPDDIFGAIKPLRMEELFKNRTSRFRARTSSANWAGADGLTAMEEREYARRMGYKS